MRFLGSWLNWNLLFSRLIIEVTTRIGETGVGIRLESLSNWSKCLTSLQNNSEAALYFPQSTLLDVWWLLQTDNNLFLSVSFPPFFFLPKTCNILSRSWDTLRPVDVAQKHPYRACLAGLVGCCGFSASCPTTSSGGLRFCSSPGPSTIASSCWTRLPRVGSSSRRSRGTSGGPSTVSSSLPGDDWARERSKSEQKKGWKGEVGIDDREGSGGKWGRHKKKRLRDGVAEGCFFTWQTGPNDNTNNTSLWLHFMCVQTCFDWYCIFSQHTLRETSAAAILWMKSRQEQRSPPAFPSVSVSLRHNNCCCYPLSPVRKTHSWFLKLLWEMCFLITADGFRPFLFHLNNPKQNNSEAGWSEAVFGCWPESSRPSQHLFLFFFSSFFFECVCWKKPKSTMMNDLIRVVRCILLRGVKLCCVTGGNATCTWSKRKQQNTL